MEDTPAMTRSINLAPDRTGVERMRNVMLQGIEDHQQEGAAECQRSLDAGYGLDEERT